MRGLRLIGAILGETCLLALGVAEARPADPRSSCGVLCSADAAAPLLRRLQAPTIQALAQSGLAYRALAVDAWGRPMPAITFTRGWNGGAQVEVRIASPSGTTVPVTVARWPVPAAGWNEVVSAVDGLPQTALSHDRESKARADTRPSGAPSVVVGCVDGWSYRVEWASGGVASASAGFCGDAVDTAYHRLVALALSASPHCAAAGPAISARVTECLATHPNG